MAQILRQSHFTERLGLQVRLGNLKVLNATSVSAVCKSSVCLAASKGIKEIELDQGSIDATVCGTRAAGPAPDLWHQPPCQRRQLNDFSFKKKVEVGINQG